MLGVRKVLKESQMLWGSLEVVGMPCIFRSGITLLMDILLLSNTKHKEMQH